MAATQCFKSSVAVLKSELWLPFDTGVGEAMVLQYNDSTGPAAG